MLPPRVPPIARSNVSPLISQGYRQALEPYTDPELLEISDHKPPLPPPAIARVTALSDKYHPYEATLTWLVLGCCLLGLTYPAWYSQVASTNLKIPADIEVPSREPSLVFN